ncbi:AtpZ/AtpI family protein [Neobacillus sp. YIM B06451]|uniref:AtpZ/AtpI family protein n=1 Tax=Neobacillus sp. YIM B06451 TaxID=3070994 RepID=UPI00293120D0|nr:AtpZ/AtpI family protein [Neobacillus sp. YIM B06451]
MKRTFSKNVGRVAEDLELGLEENMIIVHYKKGEYEKSARLLKTETKPLKNSLASFLAENNVSDELKAEVAVYLDEAGGQKGKEWADSTSFLLKALSLHVVLALVIAISVFIGYKTGGFLDSYFGLYPVFTLLGLGAGLALGGFSAYTMALKHFRPYSGKREKPRVNGAEAAKEWPAIDVDMVEVRKAVRKFSDELPKGVYRTILVNEDNSIDFSQLVHILGGIPSKKYYMSRETYDLFEEAEKDIPAEMDKVQRAVDLYVKEKREYPMLPFDPSRRVNYYQLLKDHYLKEPPKIEFYITDCDGLVTHKKPAKVQG